MKYSILTFSFGNYEILKSPDIIDDEIEYVLVTDENVSEINGWTIKYIPEHLKNASNFTKSFYVRYHPFEFVKNDIVLVIDGSIKIKKTPTKLINDFIISNKDICLSINSLSNPFNAEYDWFINTRNYDSIQANKNMQMTKALGLYKEYKGYYEANIKICKNNEKTKVFHEFVWNCLLKISDDKNHIDRLDQTILSASIDFQFPDLTVFPISRQAIKSEFMMWMEHGTNKPKDMNITPKKLFFKNNLIDIYQL